MPGVAMRVEKPVDAEEASSANERRRLMRSNSVDDSDTLSVSSSTGLLGPVSGGAEGENTRAGSSSSPRSSSVHIGSVNIGVAGSLAGPSLQGSKHMPQGTEFIVLVANRLHFSQCYVYFYLFMFILNTCAIVWVLIAGRSSSRAFLALEIIISLILTVEVTIRIVSLRQKYFVSFANVFDLVVTIICVISVGVYASGSSPFEEFEDIIALCLVCLRYVVPIVQLILWFYNGRHRYSADDEDNSVMFSRFGIKATGSDVTPTVAASAPSGVGRAAISGRGGDLETGRTKNSPRRKHSRRKHGRVQNPTVTVGAAAVHGRGGTGKYDDEEYSELDEQAALNNGATPRAGGVGMHGMRVLDDLSDSDDGSIHGGRGDVLDNVLLSHLHATRRNSIGGGSLDAIDALGGTPMSPNPLSPRSAAAFHSSFVVGKQLATF